VVVIGAYYVGYRLLVRVSRLSALGVAFAAFWVSMSALAALIFSPISLGLSATSTAGTLALLSTTAVFFGVLVVGLRVAALERAPVNLLFLRTLGRDSRSQAFLPRLAKWWTEVGNVDLLAGSDSALATADAEGLLYFMTGRLGRYVLRTPMDVQRHISDVDPRPRRDGSFTVHSIACGMAVWQMLVVELMRRNHVVVMDLRGFDERHRGCAFEIEALGRITAGAEVAFLTDDSTNQALLEELLARVFPLPAAYRVRRVPMEMTADDWPELAMWLLERRAEI